MSDQDSDHCVLKYKFLTEIKIATISLIMLNSEINKYTSIAAD